PPLESIPAVIPQELVPWNPINNKRYAGVSSFGITGTNAHVVLEDGESAVAQRQKSIASISPQEQSSRSFHLLTLSAKTAEALSSHVSNYTEFLSSQQEQSLSDICFTASAGRSHFEERLSVVGQTVEEILSKLKEVQNSSGE